MDSKFEPWLSEAEHATSRSRRLPTILTFTRGWGRNNFVSFKPPRPGTEPRTNHYPRAPAHVGEKPNLTTVPISVSGMHFSFKTYLERKQIHRSRTGESTFKKNFHREIVMLFIESDTFGILRASRSFEW